MFQPGIVIEHGGRALCRAGKWRASEVREDVAKLYAPVSGEGWVSVAGNRVTLTAGAIYLLPPHSRLSWGTQRQVLIDFLHFRLEPLWLDGKLAQIGEPMVWRGKSVQRWRNLSRQFKELFDHPTASLTCRLQAMLLEMTAAALEHTRNLSDSHSSNSTRLAPALAYLELHALDVAPPNLEQIADSLHLSPEHFHRLFRGGVGMTPLHYMLRIRMRQAQRMLADPARSVGDVAAYCGYADAFYFSRVFRQYFGRSPRQYRDAISIGP
jgi:AraC-like DNA-binding protein